MKRNQILKIAIVVCAAVLICAVAVSFNGLFGQIGGYANAEKYTAGDGEVKGTVKSLDINWTSGKVTVAYHGKDTVELRETSGRSIPEDQSMRWWLDGETLRVQYTRPGINLGWNLDKDLTVTLPEGVRLKNAEFNLTSGDLIIPELNAEWLKTDTTSGDILVAAAAEKVETACTSGNQKVKLTGKADSVRMTSTSGTVVLEAEEARQIAAASTSGNLEIRAEKNETTSLSSTSGTVYVLLKQAGNLAVSTTSGSVTAALPEAPGFTADINTTSGSVNTSMALTKNGNRYSCGDGSGSVVISTTSGSVTVEAAN